MKEKQLLETTLARMEATMEARMAQFEAMATAKDAANELLQNKIDGLIAENATIRKQTEPQIEPQLTETQSSIPSMLQKTRAGNPHQTDPDASHCLSDASTPNRS